MAAKTNTPKNYEAIATKAPTQLHEDFAQWLYIQTGVKVDLKTVQLVSVLRMDFQASPENQKNLADRKAKAAAAKKASAERKKAKLEAALAKLKGDAPVAEETEEVAPVQPMEPVKLTVVYSEGGDPEIHKFGCADLKKMTRQKGFRKETATLSSHTALTHLIYPDQADEDFDGCYLAYDTKPCCPSLDS
jgi:hypothetical protein